MKFDMRFKNIKNRHGKWVGRVRVESIGLQVGLTRIFHMIFFFFFLYKENNMYLPFRNLCKLMVLLLHWFIPYKGER